MKTKITAAEAFTLDKCERIITKAVHVYVDAGLAMHKIREGKLYRAKYSSFDEYVEKRWSKTRQWAHAVIEAACIKKSLPEKVSSTLDSQRAANEVAKVEPSKRVAVVEAAAAANPGKPVTAKAVRAAAAAIEVEEVVVDTIGREIPKALIPLWQRSSEIKELLSLVSKVKCAVQDAHDDKDIMYAEINNTVVGDLDKVYHALKCGVPYAVCAECQGHPESQPKSQCRLCLGRGLISQFRWKMVPEEKRAIIEKSVKK